jgi:hypothetical protein
MQSKQKKYKIDNMPAKEIIDKFYFDNYSLKGIDYDKKSYEPENSFYKTYFKQNKKNFLIKLITISGFSFVIGCGFGVFMLALQGMGGMGMINPMDEMKYKYDNFKQVKQAAFNVIQL